MIPRFLEVIEQLDPATYASYTNDAELQDYLAGRLERGAAQDFEDTYLHEVLYGQMSEYCPPGTFFGSHPGSSADIGCWPHESHDYEEMADMGRILYAREGDEATAQKIQQGDYTDAPDAQYGIVETDYYTYACYDREGRVLWQS